MIEIPYRDLIESASKTFGVPPGLIAAIIKVESNWDAKAKRDEPQIGDASYGLMQVLLGTARSVSGTVTPTELFRPEINIYIGSQYLYDQIKKYPKLEDAVSAYNAGRPITGNKPYVDRVMWWYGVYEFMFPYGQYVVPVGLVVGGFLTIIWEQYEKRRPRK